jgi:disulfide oxidoreductase YuzD
MTYGDNDILKYDGRRLSERFIEPVKPLDFKKANNYPENDHISSIVRGRLPRVVWNQTPHTPSNELRCCDAGGKEQRSNSAFIHPFDFTYAYFKHYTTKTIEEWLEIKVKRGFPDGNKDYFMNIDVLDEFFKVNRITYEKVKYANKLLSKNNSFSKLLSLRSKKAGRYIKRYILKILFQVKKLRTWYQ